MKDNFSRQSDQYLRYRPTYPADLFDYINAMVPAKGAAWDCGTGNGQVARELGKTFQVVHATDISSAQIANAYLAPNILYSVQPAEGTCFPDQLFDLIVVAQAIHWFNFEQFYAEVRRTAKENALLSVIGYGKIRVSDTIDAVIDDFYTRVLGSYWDKERRYLDEHYQTIPFPFEEITAPAFENKLRWTREHLIGYLNTWSAVKHFIKLNGYNPVDQLQIAIEQNWGQQEETEVRFPLLLRVGRVRKN